MTTSTTGAGAPHEAASAAGTVETDDPGTIPMLRAQIDALDAAIINLVAERAKLSTRIQTARINGGGDRVQLGRERVILDAYRSTLGSGGTNLADAVLQVCRGSF